MPAYRYYVDHGLNVRSMCEVEGSEQHHLIHVMRAEKGDRVELVNGRGSLAQAEIISISRNTASVRIESVINESSQQSTLILAQALPRLNRLDTIVEKGTELGMTELWLFPGALSERKALNKKQLDRVKHIAVAAMKQSGRLFLPNIRLLSSLIDWERPEGQLFFGDLHPDAPKLYSAEIDKSLTVAIFIGPESGFTGKEEELLKNWGARGVQLHQNVLRTDTAAIAALCYLSQ